MAGAAEMIGGIPRLECETAQDATRALYRVDIAQLFGPDFAPFANDVTRMVCIQCAIQMLNSIVNRTSFLSAEFFTLLFYIVLGVALYWLALRRLVVFT
jgi:hypothetical protein